MAAKKRKMNIIDEAAPVVPSKVETKYEAKVTAPGFFTRVQSNVKNAQMDVALGACTAITSKRNRAGKTAVLDAFRLGLTAKHPIGARAADLAGLTTDGSYPHVLLHGQVASTHYRFEGGRKTPDMTLTGEMASYQPDTLEKLLPMVSMAELLSLGTAKAREALFKRFGGAALAAGVTPPAALTQEQVVLWQQSGVTGAGDAVEKLTNAGTWLRSHKRMLGDRMRALEAEKQKLHEAQSAAGVGSPTDDLVRALQAKLDAHKSHGNTQLMRERLKVSEERLTKLIAEYEALPAITPDADLQILATLHREKWGLDKLQHEVTEQQKVVEAYKNGTRIYVLTGKLREMLRGDACLVCGHHETNDMHISRLIIEAEAIVAEQKAELAKAESRLTEVSAALRQAEDGWKAETAQAQQNHAQAKARRERVIHDLKSAKMSYEEGLKLVEAAGGAVELPKESVQELERQLAALNASKLEVGRAQGLATELRKLSIESEDCKVVEKAVGDAMAALVASVRKDAEAAVNGWMPEGFKAALMLDDEEGKPACRWEIVGTDGRAHPRGAMSGAEWAALTVAIACAWSEGQKHRFLLLDDADLAGFSAENVKKALSMVSEAVANGRLTQALVAWSRPEEIPENGWSVVSL